MCCSGSVEGDEEEQKRRVPWAWNRREDALEGAPERTRDKMVVDYMEGKDTDSLWRVLCVLEGRPISEEEMATLQQGVIMGVEGKHRYAGFL